MIFSQYKHIIILAVILALLPIIFSSNVILNFLIFGLIITLAAQGWNLLGGMAGQISFGHAAFFGTGAYITCLLQINAGLNAWIGLPLAILGGALVGLIVGYLAFRAGLRGSYFALLTLAFAEVLRVLANSVEFTGGATGRLLPINYGFENFQFSDRAYFYWIALAIVIFSIAIVQWIVFGRFGARLAAIRENEDAAKALGIDILSNKLKAIAISAGMTAAAGCLYAQYFLYIDPILVYGPSISVEVLLASMVGGLGTVLGPILGTFALHALGEAVQSITGDIPGIALAVYGCVLIIAVCFLPRGLIGLGQTLQTKILPKAKEIEA